jgi:broad specificity phosphatase PhoE
VANEPEGIPIETLFEQKVFPVRHRRDEKFPEGESLDDLACRAEVAIQECVLPHLLHAPIPEDQHSGLHVALVSHRACIGEMMLALIRLDPEADQERTQYPGPLNAAWTRVDIRVRDGNYGLVDPSNPPALEVRITNENHREHLI